MGLLSKQHRLRESRDFRAVFAAGKVYVHRLLVLKVRFTKGESPARLGFSASSKLGKAVTRNRAKRLLREAVKMLEGRLKTCGYDAVVVARPAMLQVGFEEICKVMEDLYKKADLLVPPKVT